MRASLLTLILFASLASSCSTTTAEPGVTVVHLQHTTSKDMAATLDRFLADAKASGADYPTVRASDESNSLLIEGSKEHVSQVLKLIANLDVEKPK